MALDLCSSRNEHTQFTAAKLDDNSLFLKAAGSGVRADAERYEITKTFSEVEARKGADALERRPQRR
jgi:hypothetical protein